MRHRARHRPGVHAPTQKETEQQEGEKRREETVSSAARDERRGATTVSRSSRRLRRRLVVSRSSPRPRRRSVVRRRLRDEAASFDVVLPKRHAPTNNYDGTAESSIDDRLFCETKT